MRRTKSPATTNITATSSSSSEQMSSSGGTLTPHCEESPTTILSRFGITELTTELFAAAFSAAVGSNNEYSEFLPPSPSMKRVGEMQSVNGEALDLSNGHNASNQLV